jgi:hypothetical protein
LGRSVGRNLQDGDVEPDADALPLELEAVVELEEALPVEEAPPEDESDEEALPDDEGLPELEALPVLEVLPVLEAEPEALVETEPLPVVVVEPLIDSVTDPLMLIDPVADVDDDVLVGCTGGSKVSVRFDRLTGIGVASGAQTSTNSSVSLDPGMKSVLVKDVPLLEISLTSIVKTVELSIMPYNTQPVAGTGKFWRRKRRLMGAG